MRVYLKNGSFVEKDKEGSYWLGSSGLQGLVGSDVIADKLLEEFENKEYNEQPTYRVLFKSPRVTYDDIYSYSGGIRELKATLENFNPNGLCAFETIEGDITLIHYKDIIQMYAIENNNK